MKTITTIREYDEQGRMVKETVTEYETPDPVTNVWPTQVCTCGRTTYCPMHPIYRQPNICGSTWTPDPMNVRVTNLASLS